MKQNPGFSLLELMIVIAIIIILALIAVPYGKQYLGKAKRAEAYAMLGSIATAQRAYWAEHGTYSAKLSGPDGIGWSPGNSSGGKKSHVYTYGFPGSEGANFFEGTAGASGSALSQGQVGQNSFTAVAAADIDGDGTLDVLTVDESGAITIVQDDLMQ